jgi:hypothetical protein
VKERLMDKNFTLDETSGKKFKEHALDKSFKKAEISRSLQSTYKDTPGKTPRKENTSKSGMLLIIIAILAIVCMYLGPWAFIAYDADYIEGEGLGGSIWIFRNAQAEDIEHQDIINLFKNSLEHPNYIGVTISDFTYTPAKTIGGFIALVILGLIFFIFQIIDKFLKFSEGIFMTVHSFFSGFAIIISVYTILTVSKFIGVYFQIAHNMSLEQFPNIQTIIIFINPIIAIILGFGIIKYAYTIIKIHYVVLEREKISSKVRHSFFSTGLGGKL